MNPKIKKYLFIFLILLIIIFSSVYIYKNINSFHNKDINNISTIWDDWIDIIEEIDWDDVQNKIDILKKRLSFKGLIEDGDIHFYNKEYTRALTKYLQVNKQNPSDQSIINKIWNIYFNLNKYTQATKYYDQIKDYNQLDISTAIKSLIYSEELKIDNIEALKSKILLYPLNSAEQFYYTNSLDCSIDYHLCREAFDNYFDWDIPNSTTNSWTTIPNDNEEIQELKNIQEAIINYKNFQLDDLSYKAALISGAFFQNELYPVAIATSQDTLINSPDYRPLIKIIAKSYYEIWDYINAKKFLIQYNWLWDNESEISYFLWIVHQKLREYTRSTIQLRKSLQLWFDRDLDVKRRLLFNYYQSEDTEKILWVFQEIMRDNLDEATVEDISLAIFYHILDKQNDKANTFTWFALNKFPDEEVFYWFQAWLILQNENINDEILESADSILQKWLAINDKNPMISLTLWQLEEKRNNLQKAFIYYKQTISLDEGGEYEKLAKIKLEQLELNK